MQIIIGVQYGHLESNAGCQAMLHVSENPDQQYWCVISAINLVTKCFRLHSEAGPCQKSLYLLSSHIESNWEGGSNQGFSEAVMVAKWYSPKNSCKNSIMQWYGLFPHLVTSNNIRNYGLVVLRIKCFLKKIGLTTRFLKMAHHTSIFCGYKPFSKKVSGFWLAHIWKFCELM